LVTDADIQRFLRTTSFTGYQSVPLPLGHRVPGTDRGDSIDRVLREVAGRSVLDVGTYYGALLVEAARRGAKNVVGLEPDDERFSVARQIAELHGGRYEVRNIALSGLDSNEEYDVVVCLNVLHHLDDPIAGVRQLAASARERVVLEFCTVDDPRYLVRLRRPDGALRMIDRARAWLLSRGLRTLARRLPLMAVGNHHSHRCYFNPSAFSNLFVEHHGLFRRVEFEASPKSRHDVIAVCFR
jgi:2-polyprenyl-3-methyl-5-hydroxy-6-metoxy-1,4-benzoquinol methylase